jgi:hypothetical protein
LLLSKYKSKLFALVVLSIGLYISYFQIFSTDLKYIIGDFGDSRFINAIIEYNYQWLLGNYNSYWDGFFMYPDKEVISYSDNLLGITPLYAIFRLTGNNLLTSYQLLLLLCHILNFITSYYCFYKLTGNKYAAAAGAFVFAFNLSLNSIHNHPQFTFRFAIPFSLYFLMQYLDSFKIKHFVYFQFWLLIQFYLGIYLGYFLIVFAFLIILISILIKRDKLKTIFNLKNLLYTSLSTIVMIVLLLPIFYYYYKRNKVTGYYTDYNTILETVPQLKSYLFPYSNAYLSPVLGSIKINSQFFWFHQIFPGILVYVAIILALYFAIKKRDQTLILLLITLTCIIVLFTNFNGFTLYKYLQYIPGFKAIRVVSRVILLNTFIYGWIVAVVISKIKIQNTLMRYSLVLILPLALYFDNFCGPEGFKRFEKEEALAIIKQMETKILTVKKEKDINIFAYIPKTEEEAYKVQIDAMQTAVYMKYKTINGYSSSCHGNFGPFWNNHDSTSLKQWLTVFHLSEKDVLIIK